MTTTSADKVIIERRQAYIRNVVRSVMSEESYVARISDEYTSSGRWMHGRMLSFAKIALHNSGRYLLTRWKDIRDELMLPWDVHYKHANHSFWQSSDLLNYFYTTIVRDTGGWNSSRLFGVTSYAAISENDVWEFLYAAGQHPHVEHPSLSLVATSVSAPVRLERSAQLSATNGIGLLTYESAETWPVWISISSTGMVTFTAPLVGVYKFKVRVLDIEDDIDEGEITITVT